MDIVLMEDVRIGSSLVGPGLAELGHSVRAVTSPVEARTEIDRRAFDLAVLDYSGPALDGLGLVRELRAAHHRLPILLRTVANGPEERAAGLDAGADDCVSRPTAFVELLARMNALVRRPGGDNPDTILRAQDIEMNLLRREVRRAGRRIALQPQEFRVLEQLLRNTDRVVTRTMLLDRVWGFDFSPGTTALETQVSRLRTKLNAGFSADAIETVRGAGYKLRAHSRSGKN